MKIEHPFDKPFKREFVNTYDYKCLGAYSTSLVLSLPSVTKDS